jgi:hypothetical protein
MEEDRSEGLADLKGRGLKGGEGGQETVTRQIIARSN